MSAPKLAKLVLTSLALTLAACGGDEKNPSGPQGALRIVTTSLPPAYVGEAYLAQLRSEGGLRPHTFKLEGNLPRGLTFNNGAFTGTPQEKGSFEFTAFLEDASLSRNFQKFTLTVTDPPPPKVNLALPQSETAEPFLMTVRLEGRESRAFQAQFVFKDLKAALDTLKAADGLIYVARYNAEKGILDVDAAWITPRKDTEALRLSLTPAKPLRPLQQMAGNIKTAFYDKDGKRFAQADTFPRDPSQGQYDFETLLLIAQNWGKKAQPAENKQGESPNTQPNPPANAQPAPPAEGKPGETQPAQPPQGQTGGEQGQNPAPKPEEPKTEGQTPAPAKPAEGQPAPAPAPQALPGDLNKDNVVDAKDLEALRASYAWKSVGAPAAPPKTNQPNPSNPPADKKETTPPPAEPKKEEAAPQQPPAPTPPPAPEQPPQDEEEENPGDPPGEDGGEGGSNP